MGRGRKRKAEEPAEPECQLEQRSNPSSIQDSSNCLLSHYLARCANVARYPIRSRIQSQAASNIPSTPMSAKRGKKIENFSPMAPSNASNDSAQAPPAAALTSSHENLVEEANEASNIVGSAKNCGRSEEHQGQTSSFNLTEVAEMVDGDSSDLCEVESRESCLDFALVTVNGYRVKPQWAFLINSIFLKHGDIAKDCSFVGSRCRSFLLEIVCDIVQKLRETEFVHITPVDLKSMLDHVRDLEMVNVEVGWLHQRLNDIYQATRLYKGYSSLKEAQRRGMQALETKEEEIVALQEKIRMLDEDVLLAKNELAPMRADANEIDEKVSEAKAKVRRFYQKPLVQGLL